jgi:hypothetical protein
LVAGGAAVFALVAVVSVAQSSQGWWAVGLLSASVAVLLWKARPDRPREQQLAKALDRLASRGGLVIQLTSHTADSIGRAGSAYAAIARSDTSDVLLAQADEPASVLAVARYWQLELGAPLLAGWGLTQADLEAVAHDRPFPTARVDYLGRSQHGATGNAVGLLCSAIALAILVGSVAILRQDAPSTLSLVLFGVGLGVLLLLAAATHTDVTRILLHDRLEVERRCLGFKLGGLKLPSSALRLLRIVSPEGNHGRHLLIASSEGFGAIECAAELETSFRDPVVDLPLPLSGPPPQREEHTAPIVSGEAMP